MYNIEKLLIKITLVGNKTMNKEGHERAEELYYLVPYLN